MRSCQENRKILLRICVFFLFVYFLSVGIPILKIVLSHTHKSIASGIILFKLFFSLVMGSSGGPGMVNG